jgi:hypothetical protein
MNTAPTTRSLRLPDFIGVGPPRTATTWLHEALMGHVGLPEGVKETDFFIWQYEKGLEWYAAHFRGCRPDLPVGEFSPNYFGETQPRERIARDIPRCKIICTLRDPVARTYSHYRKMLEGGYFSGSFEDCLADERRRNVVEWSRYAPHLAEWQRLFGAENVLVLIQDDLKADAQSFLDRTCDFIGIARIPLGSMGARDEVNTVSSLPRNRHLARAARKVRDGLQKQGSYTVVNWLKRIGLRDFLFSGGRAFEPLRPETEVRLRQMFRSDVETLEAMLGRDLSLWKNGR